MKNKGITLVALVVTIIILLILAGITISQLTRSGLFENAKLAEQKSKEAQEKEEETLSDYSNLIQEVIGTRDDTVTISTSQLTELIKEIVKEEVNQTPTGAILAQMGNETPEGYLFCDGATYDIEDYKDLANYINKQFGKYNYFGGDGETTFAVPNLQGEFLRGYSTNSGSSKSNGVTTANVGGHQEATTMPFIYMATASNVLQIRTKDTTTTAAPNYIDKSFSNLGSWYNFSKDTQGTQKDSLPYAYSARPTNTSVLYCIKY